MALVLATTLAGCVAGPPDDLRSRFRDMFPLLDSLALTTYWDDDRCHYLAYGRGTFYGGQPNSDCWTERSGGGVAMDDQAAMDFQMLRDAFSATGTGLEYVAVHRDGAGSAGPGTFFRLDRCTTYHYAGSPTPPEVEDATVIAKGDGWFLIDTC